MKLSILLTWLCLLTFYSCNSKEYKKNNEQLTDNKMNKQDTISYYTRKYDPITGVEMYNFELTKKITDFSKLAYTKDGWTIVLGRMNPDGAINYEYPPLGKFYKVQKIFHFNGMLKQECSFYLGNLMIGKSKYYDEGGNLIQVMDEDKKFEKSKIQIDDILKFMHNKGWLNMETGKGRTEIMEQSGHVVILQAKFSIKFLEEKGIPYWYVYNMEDHHVTVGYKINGITGESERFEQKIEVRK